MTDSTAQPYPAKLSVEAGDRLAIEWSDGVRHELPFATLRRNCPCAACRTEREKPQPLLAVISIEETQPARPKAIHPVGRYAYQIAWRDGHDSGIFTFEFLRELGESSKTP